MKVFGDPNLPVDQEWPTLEEIKSISYNKQIKLDSIEYLNCNNLEGIKLKFTSGLETPWFNKDEIDKQGHRKRGGVK